MKANAPPVRLAPWSAVSSAAWWVALPGCLASIERPRFHSYVVEQRRPSYEYSEPVRIGAVLPEQGVTYYEVPPEYGVRDYRYTVVNGRTVLVEPRTTGSSRSLSNEILRTRAAAAL